MPSRAFTVFASCLTVAAITTAAHAEGRPRDEKVRINPVIQARVGALMLHRADFPAGWTGHTLAYEGTRRCTDVWDPDLSTVTIIGRARSKQFISGLQYVSSVGEAYENASQLTVEWRAIATSRFVQCLARTAENAINAPGVRAKVQSVTSISLPHSAPRQMGWRLGIEVMNTRDATAKTVDAWTDVIYLGRGRVLVGFSFTGFFTRPNRVLETRLVTLTGRRLGKSFAS